MRATVIFLSFLIIWSSQATSEIDQLEKSSLGKNLLDTIALQVRAGEPVQVLMKMLSDMADNLSADQKHQDEIHDIFQNNCKIDVDNLSNDIKDAQGQINSRTADLNVVRPALNSNKRNLASSQSDLVDLQIQLAKSIEARRAEEVAYKKKELDHINARDAVNKVKRLFLSLKKEPSFLEANSQSIFAQIKASSSEMVNKVDSKKFRPLVKILASITDRAPLANQEIVNKILNIIDQILKNIDQSWDLETQAEKARIKAFEEKKEQQEKEILSLNSEINSLTERIANQENQIQTDERIIKEQNTKLQFKTSELDAKLKNCQDEEKSYITDKNRRDEERDIVNKVILLVRGKLGGLSDYLKKRIN